jgi:hypothetical protein
VIRSGEELSFRWEWEPAADVRSPELKATWARLEIWIGDECVTEVEDRDSQSARRSVYVSLYPLAEWVAFNWWLLKADARPGMPARSTSSRTIDSPLGGRSLLHRHNLRSAGEGFRWPDLTLVPEGQTTRLVWWRDREVPTTIPIRYIGQGESFLDGKAVETTLSAFVESVLTRLSEQGVAHTTLAAEWDNLKQTDQEEAQFCLAAARLGLDPYSEAAAIESEILRAADQLGEHVFDDFVDAVSPQQIGAGLEWIAEARSLIESQSGPANQIVGRLRADLHRETTVGPRNRPWERGWQQAGRLRQLLGAQVEEVFDLSDLVVPKVRSTPDRGLQAAGGASGGSTPVVVLGRAQSDEVSRFTLARGLWRILSQHDPLFLVTAAHTDKQKAERAFAAELLAPAAGIAQRLEDGAGAITMEDLEPVAQHFRVSPLVIQHQVENQLAVGIVG